MKPWTSFGLLLAAVNCVSKSIRERSGNESGAAAGIGWTAAVWLSILQVGILGAGALYYLTNGRNIWWVGDWNFGSTVDGFKSSIVTILSLLAYGAAVLSKRFDIGWALIGIGGSTIIGWVFGCSQLYFQAEINNGVTAVALNTGVCLLLLGISLLNRKSEGCVPVA